MPPSTPIPLARPTDSQDVSWALSTAQTSWGRGDPREAVKWLRRAAEAASEADDDKRALELAKAVAELASRAAKAPPNPPSVPPRPSAGRTPRSPSRPTATTRHAPAALSKSAHKDDRRPGGRGTRRSVPDAEEAPVAHADEPNPRTAKKGTRRSYDELTRPATSHELEAMETQSMRDDELPTLSYDENGRTRGGASHRRAAVATPGERANIIAAARAFLVRDEDGELRVSSSPVEGGVAVVLVPLDGAVDLRKLLDG